ncbi:uncharacterized protein LOC144564622 [Carex rostrata]
MDPAQAMAMIEDMAINQREWTAERGARAQTTPGMVKVDEVTALRAQMEALQHQVAQIHSSKSMTKKAPCGICGEVTHITAECQVLIEGDEIEQANTMFYNQGDKRNDPIYNKVRQNDNFNSNSYNPNNRCNHPNFKWKTENNNSNQYQSRPNQNSYQGTSQNSNIEKMIQDLMTQVSDFTAYQRNTNTDVSDSLRDLKRKFELLDTKTSMLETQIAQQASLTSRQQGTLPGKPDINSREYANAITLRSDTKNERPKMMSIEEQQQLPKETQPPPAPLNANTPASNQSQESGNSNPTKVKPIETPKYIPPLRFVPFPQRLVKNKLDQQFTEFVDQKKCTIEKSEHVILDEKCSAIFSTDLPPKMKDPGSFSIPCSINTTRIENAMCDLGASVSLMPKSVYDKLESSNLEPTNMTLTLADGTTRSPLGILKNVVVKIGKIKIPDDFVVIETDDHSTVLLGRAFLATAGANIKVKEGELSFSVGKKKENFYFHKPLIPSIKNSVCMIEISQVNREFVQKKSVATSETDKPREVIKTKQAWLPKAKCIKLMEIFKNRSKKKKLNKTEQWGGRPPDPPPNH